MSPVFRHGRLRLYLLKLLDEAPRHGYEVIRLLQDRFLGVYAPSPGTIYPRLARLEEEGLVTHDEVDGKKVYRITDKGREEIRARLDDLAELEEEITESVRDIAREVTQDVRDTVRNLREELTWAARDVRREDREQARDAAGTGRGGSVTKSRRAPAGPGARPGAAGSRRGTSRRDAGRRISGQGEDTPAGPRPGDRPAQAAGHARDGGRTAAVRPERPGRPRMPPGAPAGGPATAPSSVGGPHGMAGLGGIPGLAELGGLAGAARQAWLARLRRLSWLSGTGLRSAGARGARAARTQAGRGRAAGPDAGLFRDLERLAVEFARELRTAAWHTESVGENALGDLRAILEDTLTKVKDEVFGGAGADSGEAGKPAGTTGKARPDVAPGRNGGEAGPAAPPTRPGPAAPPNGRGPTAGQPTGHLRRRGAARTRAAQAARTAGPPNAAPGT